MKAQWLRVDSAANPLDACAGIAANRPVRLRYRDYEAAASLAVADQGTSDNVPSPDSTLVCAAGDRSRGGGPASPPNPAVCRLSGNNARTPAKSVSKSPA